MNPNVNLDESMTLLCKLVGEGTYTSETALALALSRWHTPLRGNTYVWRKLVAKAKQDGLIHRDDTRRFVVV